MIGPSRAYLWTIDWMALDEYTFRVTSNNLRMRLEVAAPRV